MVTAIVLAAGKSIRLGTTKQLLSYQDSPIIRLVANTLLQSDANKVITVLGHKASEIADALNGLPVITTINQDYHQGQSTSIKAGLSVYEELIWNQPPEFKSDNKRKGIMFYLSDQPLIKPETINLLINSFHEFGGIVVPYYQNTRGNPVIFETFLMPQFQLLKGDVGAREVIFNNPQEIRRIDVNDPGVIFDIDTWEDYTQLTAAGLLKEALKCRDLR